ncbi:hypothetical protein [Streptomyces sp. SAS_276]|uniref:hypothetical protein n=1 Tax=Streptomyces sp. SAS_276 TaxID=3412745 RepID=UPI00403C0217
MSSRHERLAVSHTLRTDAADRLVLLVAAVTAWERANSSLRGADVQIRDVHVGVPAFGLGLAAGRRPAGGRLTVVIVLAGIELKRQLVLGEPALPQAASGEHGTAAILLVSVTSALLVTMLLRGRALLYRYGHEENYSYADADGIPDAYEQVPLLSAGAHRCDVRSG